MSSRYPSERESGREKRKDEWTVFEIRARRKANESTRAPFFKSMTEIGERKPLNFLIIIRYMRVYSKWKCGYGSLCYG